MKPMKLQDKLLQGYQLYQNIRILNDPYDLERILNVSETLLRYAKPEDVEKVVEGMRWSQDAVAAIESRYRLEIPDLEHLLGCPDATLGRAFGEFLVENAINPKDLRPPEVKDDLSYLAAHFGETHDLWHLITGFKPDLDGEAGIAAFAAAQTNSPFQVSIVAGLLLHGLKEKPWELSPRLDAVSRGWRMGTKAKPLFGFRWDRHWISKITEVRQLLNIELS